MSLPGSPSVIRTADRVRVIHVAPTPFGQAGLFGGGERYPLELARALASQVECELVTFGRRASVHREPGGLCHRTLPVLGWLGGHPAHPIAPGLPRVLSNAHVVHTHHMRSLPSRVAALVRRARQQTVVVTDHGLQGNTWGGLLPRLFDLFLTVSAYSAHELGAPAPRTRVIYGGADPMRYAPDAAEARGGVLFVGRLTPHKGVDRLVQALPRDAHLRVVGSTGHDPRPPERDYPKLLRFLARDRHVTFVGTLADDDLPGMYRSAAVLAMASGTPVVASRVGGLAEVVEDGQTGFLVPAGDVVALRDRLEQLLGDPPLARRLGANAREMVLQRFTWARVAERCLDAYGSA